MQLKALFIDIEPGGPLIENMLACVTRNSQKRVLFERKAQMCNSTTMNFRDMSPFEYPLVTHLNIGFNTSGPRGYRTR